MRRLAPALLAIVLALAIAALDALVPHVHLMYGEILPLIIFGRAYGFRVAIAVAAVLAVPLAIVQAHGLPASVPAIGSDALIMLGVFAITLLAFDAVDRERARADGLIGMRTIAEEIPHLVWTHDRHGRIEHANRRFRSFVGRRNERFIPALWRATLHPDDYPGAVASLQIAIAKEEPFEAPFRARAAGGEENDYRWYITRSAPVRDEAGIIRRWVATATDIHEERTLTERRERSFREIAEALPDLVFIVRPDSSVYYNRRWNEYTGRDLPQEAPEVVWELIVHPDDRDAARARWRDARERGVPCVLDFRFRRFDGAYRWHIARIDPICETSGAIERWFGTITDVHESRVAAETRENELRAITETIPQIVWCAAADGGFDYYSARWYQYTGFDANDALGEGWASALHPEDRAPAMAAWENAVRNGATFDIEYRVRRADGAFRWFLARATAVRRADGTIERWFGTLTDIHDRKTERDQLTEALVREHRVSDAFQRASLPRDLPHVPGLSFAAVYEAARAEALVGGDWYDAFRLTDGRIVISIGDVAGKGLTAAVTMALVRQVVRGAAQIYPDPMAVLNAADRALRADHPDTFVTAFVGVLDPIAMTLTYASAGHPPPLLRLADGRVEELDAFDLPLGLRGRETLPSRLVTIAAGSQLVLYTDGLIEASRDLQEGEQRLHETFSSPQLPESVDPARFVRDAMLPSGASDDVAILVVSIGDRGALPVDTPQGDGRWTFAGTDVVTAMRVRRAVSALLRLHGASDEDIFDGELIFAELIGNVVRHAPAGNVEIVVDFSNAAPVLHVLDRGPGFRFTARLPYEALSESGRGLFIVATIADDVTVTPRPGGGSHVRAVLPYRRMRLRPVNTEVALVR